MTISLWLSENMKVDIHILVGSIWVFHFICAWPHTLHALSILILPPTHSASLNRSEFNLDISSISGVHLIDWISRATAKAVTSNFRFKDLVCRNKTAVNALLRFCVYREVGIECQEVPGHSKGIGYRQGQSLKNVKSDHLWNAVLLAGQWFLLDACWGAGRVNMEHESFVKRFEKGRTLPYLYSYIVLGCCSVDLVLCLFSHTQNQQRVESHTSLLSPSVVSKVRWFLFPHGPRGVHRFPLPRWGEMATAGQAHTAGRVWEESVQNLHLLRHGAPADSASSLSHRHRFAHSFAHFTRGSRCFHPELRK